jgi:hypothetical protein
MRTAFSGHPPLQIVSRASGSRPAVAEAEPRRGETFPPPARDALGPAPQPKEWGDFLLPASTARELSERALPPGFTLDDSLAIGNEPRVRFHGIRGATSYTALLHVTQPDAQYPGGSMSALFVSLCKKSRLLGLGTPMVVILAPGRGALAEAWFDEFDECKDVGVTSDVKFAWVRDIDTWAISEEARASVQKWAAIPSSPGRPPAQADAEAAVLDTRPRPGLPIAATAPTGLDVKEYFIFIACPGDLATERQKLREYFEAFNRNKARPLNFGAIFTTLDWERDSIAGVGRPQELITAQVLERNPDALALVVCLLKHRFGTATGGYGSGTEEEFEWALKARAQNGTWPEIMCFFDDSSPNYEGLSISQKKALGQQYDQVLSFRERLEANSFLCRAYQTDFDRVVLDNIERWLNDQHRPWHPRPSGGNTGSSFYDTRER